MLRLKGVIPLRNPKILGLGLGREGGVRALGSRLRQQYLQGGASAYRANLTCLETLSPTPPRTPYFSNSQGKKG